MHRGSLVALLAAQVFACSEPRERARADPDRPAPLPDDDACAGCHDDIAAEWAASRHHTSFTNPAFQRSYARETTPFCHDCHAPAHARLPAAAAEALGVGCLDCHGDGATIVSGGAGPSAAPHPLRREPGFGTDACARCHEFDFPPGSEERPGTMMQTTLREHRASPHADRSCADCHMPRADRSRHDFASTRDPAAHRRALAVEARRDGDALVLDLRPHEVGHAFPTGDLFRRLAVHATWVDPDGRAADRGVRYLARHFVTRRHPDGRLRHAATRPVVDDRVFGPTTVYLAPDNDVSTAELVWSISLERVDARDFNDPENSTLADTIHLAGGRLPSQQLASPAP